MLRSLRDLERYEVSATDGDIGRVGDFFLDDERWAIRHLVVETRGFLDGRRVLISPISFRRAEWSTRRFQLDLTKQKVKDSPGVDLDKPVSRQHERDFYRYYGYPYYWGYTGMWGMGAYPSQLLGDGWNATAPVGQPDEVQGDVHLRSANEIRGYRVEGSDGVVGRVRDFIVDDESWAVRYLVVDTHPWWFGKKVLVAPQWARRISWDERKVYVAISRQAIEQSPPWDGAAAVDREYEQRLFDHYGRPAHWVSGAHPTEAKPPPPSMHHPG
ncbi:MAG: PRC-barrel domain-containing protein [Deltaproteobacteria bacterium]